MKVWLPQTRAKSGSAVFMDRLGAALNERGIEAQVQTFDHAYQYAPSLLANRARPVGTTAMITNSWSGFAFHRPGIRSICVEHLFVLDPAFAPYKSLPQRIFHEAILSRNLRRSYASADHVIAVSAYTATALHERFPSVEPKVIRNGVDTHFFSPASEVAEETGYHPFRLGFAGNQTPRKGADLLVPIMERLGPDFELWHTGGQLSNVPAALRSRIIPKGHLGIEEMRNFYRSCDALLMPTRLEGLPLTVLEAQACGLPVLTTDCSSLPEAIEDGVTGWVCPVDDVEAMVVAISRLAADPPRRANMAKAARERATSELSFDTMVDAYVDLLSATNSSKPIT